MAFIRDAAFDLALEDINNGTIIHICTSEPATYAAATGAASCGNETAITVGAPAAGTVSGRMVTIPAITAGDVTATDTATHWALVDGAILYATGILTAPQAVTSGNTFTLDAITINILDGASV